MTNREAVLRIEDHMDVHKIGQYPHTKIAEALTIAITAIRALEQQEQNEPLTWEQVKERVGAPVWLEDVMYSRYSGWRTVGMSNNTFVSFSNRATIRKDEVGQRYIIYAREPKHAPDERSDGK